MADRVRSVIIPVIDVKDGIVVHAIAGRREEYRPLTSQLTDSTNVTDVHQTLTTVTGSRVCYVADLDAIMMGTGPSTAIRRLVESTNSVLWLDFGIRTVADANAFVESNHVCVVIGTETIRDISNVLDTLHDFGPERAVLSIDEFGTDPRFPIDSLLQDWTENGGRIVIWLNMAAVGTGRFEPSTTFRTGLRRFPQLRHYHGGGVKNQADVDHMMSLGASGTLVATALHTGSLSRKL